LEVELQVPNWDESLRNQYDDVASVPSRKSAKEKQVRAKKVKSKTITSSASASFSDNLPDLLNPHGQQWVDEGEVVTDIFQGNRFAHFRRSHELNPGVPSILSFNEYFLGNVENAVMSGCVWDSARIVTYYLDAFVHVPELANYAAMLGQQIKRLTDEEAEKIKLETYMDEMRQTLHEMN